MLDGRCHNHPLVRAMRLPQLRWDDPILEAFEIAKSKTAENRRSEFDAAYRRYALKLSHISLIWDKLRNVTDAYEKYIDLLRSSAENLSTGEFRSLTLDQVKDSEKFDLNLRALSLDYEDFLIHSRILMDRVVFLTQFFMPRTEETPSFHSFTDHRKFFVEKHQFQDAEYATYIRENTTWYETMLRPYRDTFVVHDTTFKPMGLSSGPEEPPRFTRVPGREVETQRHLAWSSIVALREKYLGRIPGLDAISVNVYELTDFFESHASMVEPEDLKMLEEVRRSFGAKLPDLIALAAHIQQYLNFVGSHLRILQNKVT